MKDDMGRTPLLLACEQPSDQWLLWLDEERCGSQPCALELISAGANIHAADNEGSTALHKAVRSGFPRTASLLLEAGAYAAVKDQSGAILLFHALSCNRPRQVLEMVSLLRKSCPGIMQQTHPSGKTPLHLLAPWLLELSTDPDVYSKLLDEEGRYIDYDRDPSPHAPKELADFQTLYQEFVNLGWSREARDALGNTPIFYYAGMKPDLWRGGANSPGYFPPDLKDTSKMFADHDITVVNNVGDTLLHAVAGRGANAWESGSVGLELFKQLLDMGLDPRKENKKGVTPLDVAASRGNKHILDLFAEK
jgi:ankyrin repeat protein